MTWVATAIVGGALIGTVGTAIAAGNAAGAATQAANIQANAANNAAAMQGQIYSQTRNDLLPFQNTGRSAIPYINSLIPGGLGTSNPALPASLGASQYQIAGVDAKGNPVYIDHSQNPGTSGQYFSGATGGTAPTSSSAAEGGQKFVPAIQQIPSGGDAGPTAASSANAFTVAQLANLPQLGSVAQSSLGALVPGSGTNPLQSSLYSYVNGSSLTPNPLLSAVNNSILGASGNPNAALGNLASFSSPSTNASLSALNNLLGLGSQDPAARQAALEATPGYQFTLDQGLKATQNGFAAQGLGASGAALKGAAQFATGLADQTYQAQLNNYLNNYNSQFTNAYNLYNTTTNNAQNAFANQSNLALNSYNSSFNNALNLTGQQFTNTNTAYQNQVSNALNLLGLGANAASQTGQAGVQTANNAANYLTSGAAASAGGIVGSANAINNSIINGANSLGGVATLYGLNPSLFGSSAASGGNALSAGGAFNPTGIYS